MTLNAGSTNSKFTVEQLHQGFFLAEIAVKPDIGVIIRDGKPYKLAPKAMQILVCLASNNCQIQTRERILQYGWGDSPVSSNNLTHIISDIRHALGDRKECPRFIQTIPRKGYRMMVETTLNAVLQPTNLASEPSAITEVPIADNTQDAEKSFIAKLLLKKQLLMMLSLLVIVLAFLFIKFSSNQVTKIEKPTFSRTSVLNTEPVKKVTENAIAILLFKQLKGQDTASYILPSIQEELVGMLTHHPEFQVSSIRATNDLGTQPSVDLIRERLKVKYILDGSITQQQQNIEISANLIDSITGFQVWSGESVGNVDELLTVYDELSRKLINGLNLLGFGDKINAQSSNKLPTTSFAAYDAYLQGKAMHRNKQNMQSLLDAERLFKSALQHDPNFILASSSLCTIYLELFSTSDDIQYYDKGLSICERSANSDKAGTESSLALSQLYNVTGRYQQAKALLDKTIIKDPNNPELLITLAHIYANLKDKTSARQYFLRAITTEPAYWRNYHEYGIFLFHHGEFEQAISQFKKSISLNDQFSESYNALGGAYFLTYNFDQANIAWSQALAIDTTPTTLTNLATSLFFLKKFNNAVQIYLQSIELNPNDNVVWGNLGDAYKYANKPDKALMSYQQALELAQQQEQINPNNITVQAQIGRYYSELQQCNNANSYKDSLLSHPLDDPYIFYDLALLAINCKQMLQAEGFINKALENGYEKSLLLFDPQFSDFKDLL